MVVEPGLCGTWSETQKTGFLKTRLKFNDTQGIQCRQVFVVKFLVSFSMFFFCFVDAIFDLVHGGCGGYLSPSLNANGI